MCREGVVLCTRHAGAWYVNEASLAAYLRAHAREQDEQRRKQSEERKRELAAAEADATPAQPAHTPAAANDYDPIDEGVNDAPEPVTYQPH